MSRIDALLLPAIQKAAEEGAREEMDRLTDLRSKFLELPKARGILADAHADIDEATELEPEEFESLLAEAESAVARWIN